jgi:hypothetical protein
MTDTTMATKIAKRGKKHTSVYMPTDLAERITVLADLDTRSFNQMVVRLLLVGAAHEEAKVKNQSPKGGQAIGG